MPGWKPSGLQQSLTGAAEPVSVHHRGRTDPGGKCPDIGFMSRLGTAKVSNVEVWGMASCWDEDPRECDSTPCRFACLAMQVYGPCLRHVGRVTARNVQCQPLLCMWWCPCQKKLRHLTQALGTADMAPAGASAFCSGASCLHAAALGSVARLHTRSLELAEERCALQETQADSSFRAVRQGVQPRRRQLQHLRGLASQRGVPQAARQEVQRGGLRLPRTCTADCCNSILFTARHGLQAIFSLPAGCDVQSFL